MENEKIEFEYYLKLVDYLKYSFLSFFTRINVVFLFFLQLFIIGFWVYLFNILKIVNVDFYFNLIFFGFIIIFNLLIPFLWFLKSRKVYLESGFDSNKIKCIIDKNGVHQISSHGSFTCLWKDIKNYKLSKSNIIFFIDENQAFIFPTIYIDKEVVLKIKNMVNNFYKRS